MTVNEQKAEIRQYVFKLAIEVIEDWNKEGKFALHVEELTNQPVTMAGKQFITDLVDEMTSLLTLDEKGEL